MTDEDIYRPRLSYSEVAEILGMTRQNVFQWEQRALRKLRSHPVMIQLAKDWDILKGEEE